MSDYKTTFHRNGTITYWNVFLQQWCRNVMAMSVPLAVLATLPVEVRTRVLHMRVKEAVR